MVAEDKKKGAVVKANASKAASKAAVAKTAAEPSKKSAAPAELTPSPGPTKALTAKKAAPPGRKGRALRTSPRKASAAKATGGSPKAPAKGATKAPQARSLGQIRQRGQGRLVARKVRRPEPEGQGRPGQSSGSKAGPSAKAPASKASPLAKPAKVASSSKAARAVPPVWRQPSLEQGSADKPPRKRSSRRATSKTSASSRVSVPP